MNSSVKFFVARLITVHQNLELVGIGIGVSTFTFLFFAFVCFRAGSTAAGTTVLCFHAGSVLNSSGSFLIESWRKVSLGESIGYSEIGRFIRGGVIAPKGKKQGESYG
jgi:hypothetical protein